MRERISIDLRLYTEGRAKFYASNLEKLKQLGLDYTSAEVFYNPRMVVNRDIAVAVLRWLVKQGKDTAADLMAASGVRALRFALETDASEVLANDKDPLCAAIIRKNAALNRVMDKVKVLCEDANALAEKLGVRGERYELIDLDPFGSPVPFIPSAIKAVKVGGVLAVTATDEPPLFGIKSHKLLRAYGVWGAKTEYCKEFGLRVLIGYIVREAARYDLALTPMLAHVTDHYVRAYMVVNRGAERAKSLLTKRMGWIVHCFFCGYRTSLPNMSEIPKMRTCVDCGRESSLMGPVWIGDFVDVEAGRKVLELIPSESLSYSRSRRVLEAVIQEFSFPPYFYSLEAESSRLRLPTPPTLKVIEELRSLGYKAVRSHVDRKGIKTDAPINVLREVINRLSGRK